MSSRNRRKGRKNHNIVRASSSQQQTSKRRERFSSYIWTPIVVVALIAPIVAVIAFQSAHANAMRSSDSNITHSVSSPLLTPTVQSSEHSGASESSPYPYFYPDTEVLVYTGNGDTGWRPIPFGIVPWGVEFLFEGRFYDIDPEGRVRVNLSVEANATNLTEADRPFEPYKSRWPEPEDLVRFVDEDNRHLFHNRAGTCQAGDRFWFQGVLYRCLADPSDPSSLIVKSTYHVLDGDGRVMPVEEFALARGDSLEEVYGSQFASAGFVGGTVSGSGDTFLTGFDGGVLPTRYGGQQPSNIQSGMNLGSGVGGMPTDFGFAGQRYDSSTGLIYMGARYYDPSLGRFISPDAIVQQRNDPQSYNRYAYARNNPLRYTDESGHCWGIASGLRNVPGYGVTCNNLDMALTIVQHQNASFGQKAGAAAYIATEGTAHLALGVGVGMLAWEGGAAVIGTVGGTEAATTAGTAATMACADGDCTNEVRAVSNALCADGDCTNEVNAAIRTARSVWEMNPLQRGLEIENMLGRSSGLPQNFPVIDRFSNGVATSIKSIDLSAASYQNVNTLSSVVRGYVNTLANWQGTYWGGFEVRASDIVAREVLLAIPPGATEAQMAALQQLQQWATTVGVNLNIVVVP